MGAVFLRKFARGDIETRRQNADGLIVFVEQGRLVAVEGEFDILAEEFLFIVRYRNAGFQYHIVAALFAFNQIGRQYFGYRLANQFFRIAAEQGGLIGVQEQELAVAVRGIDQDRRRIDNLFEHRLSARLAAFFVFFRAGAVIGGERLLQLLLFLVLAEQQNGPVAKFDMRHRTLQEVGCTGIKRADPAFTVLPCCNDDGGNMRTDCPGPEFGNERGAVHFRHAVVHDQQIGMFGFKPFQGFHGAVKAGRGIFRTHHSDILRIDAQIGRTIINNDYARLHTARDSRRTSRIG